MKKLLTSFLIFSFLTAMVGSSFASNLTNDVSITTKPLIAKVNTGLAKKIEKLLFG